VPARCSHAVRAGSSTGWGAQPRIGPLPTVSPEEPRRRHANHLNAPRAA
jgi:hypothetical protein